MPSVNTKIHLDSLFQLLTIPSISAQSAHKKDMEKACSWLAKRLTKLGFNAEILPTKGHPIVYAELTTNNLKPTVLIYGHYDVQDPGNLDEWLTKPFNPVINNGNIIARGSADDKGQLYTWIAAIENLLFKFNSLPVNIKFVIEGEEEVGSKNFEKFVFQNKKLLKSDVCLISDSHSLTENQPLIDYGLRGLVYIEVELKTLGKDVHSGTYGGNVLNPAIVLAQIIAKLKSNNHKILIPGFYDNVRTISKRELQVLSAAPIKGKNIKSETGASKVVGEKDFTIPARSGARPTLDVNGIWSGYTGEGVKTIIPGVASAKISMRLVPNQNPEEIAKKFEKYFMTLVPKGAKVKIQRLSEGYPIIFNKDGLYFKKAENAARKVFGNKPKYTLSGGSIAATTSIKQTLGIDCVMLGYGLPDDNLHGPNEKLSVSMFEKGITTNSEFLKSL